MWRVVGSVVSVEGGMGSIKLGWAGFFESPLGGVKVMRVRRGLMRSGILVIVEDCFCTGGIFVRPDGTFVFSVCVS